MKSFIHFFEEAMTTASIPLGTGDDIKDDDARVPSGTSDVDKRVKEDSTSNDPTSASDLVDLPGDEVADKQKKAQPLQAPDGADSSGV